MKSRKGDRGMKMDRRTRYVLGGIIATLGMIGATIAILNQNLKKADSRVSEELARMQLRLDNEIAERRYNQTQIWEKIETAVDLLLSNDSSLNDKIDAAAKTLSGTDFGLNDKIDTAANVLSDTINQTSIELLALADHVSQLEVSLQGQVSTTSIAIQAINLAMKVINQTMLDNRQAIQNLAQKQLADIEDLAVNLTKALDSLDGKIDDTAKAIRDELAQELLAVTVDIASLQSQVNALGTDTRTLGDSITALDTWARTQAEQLRGLIAELDYYGKYLEDEIDGLTNITAEANRQIERIVAELGNQNKTIDWIRQNLTAIWTELGKDPVVFNSYNGWQWSICRAIENVSMSNSQTTVFNGQLIFQVQNSTHSILYSYSRISGTLTVLQTAPLPNSFWPKTIDDMLYVVKRFASFPTYNGTVYSTADLETWNVEASTDQCCLQSIAKYAPTGAIYTGGVYSTGEGTYTRIMKLSDGSLNVVWDGSVWESDDGIEMDMFNSTMIVCFDAYKANVIYSTDPDNSWTDSEETTLFDWIHGVDIRDGDLWMAGCDDWAGGNTGLAKWDGKTYTGYLLEKTCWRVCNGSVGVSEGREDPNKEDPKSFCSIYTYTTDGTLDRLTLQCSCNSMIRGMAYDSSRDRLFALFWVPFRGVFVLEGYPST